MRFESLVTLPLTTALAAGQLVLRAVEIAVPPNVEPDMTWANITYYSTPEIEDDLAATN